MYDTNPLAVELYRRELERQFAPTLRPLSAPRPMAAYSVGPSAVVAALLSLLGHAPATEAALARRR